MAGRHGGSRTGTFLVLCGTLGILTATFVAGVWTGRHWPVLFGQPRAAVAESPAPRRAGAERPRPADALPVLTFYDELKAPLTAPPPLPRPARPPRPPEPIRKDDAAEAPGPAVPPTPTATADAGSRFTVQVGAYHVRAPAETLRATLASAGHEARVVEAVTPTGVRYRVQVGTFVTRQAAQDAAARLSAERAVPSFVTAR